SPPEPPAGHEGLPLAVVATANPLFGFAVGSSGWEMEKPTTRRALVVATSPPQNCVPHREKSTIIPRKIQP
ncbi:MAG: hypothetical protein ABSF14_23935, partial [Terriglobia bacterium]